MNKLTFISTISCLCFLNTVTQSQIGISHTNHNHSTLASLSYEPYGDYDIFKIRYGKFLSSHTFIAANLGYSPGYNWTPIGRQSRDLYTAGIDSEYLITNHIAQYNLGISIAGKYQYEFHHNGTNESEHHFDMRAVAYYPIRIKKLSISPYGSYGFSDFSSREFTHTRAIGGIISFHFSKSDYCYLLIYNQRYDNGIESSPDHRTFVNLGLLW